MEADLSKVATAFNNYIETTKGLSHSLVLGPK